MAVVTLTQDEIALRDLVGTQPLLRGRVLARNGGVQAVARSRDLGRVVGTVRDDDGSFQVAVNVRQGADGRLVGIDGWCECGRAVPCAHAVALLLAGTPAGGTPAGGPPAAGDAADQNAADQNAADKNAADRRPASRPVVVERPRSSWEQALTAALTSPQAGPRRRSGSQRAVAEPSTPVIALQFELTGEPFGVVGVRPVVPGRSGAWVRSGVSWASLQYPEYHLRHVPARQVDLLRELAALAGSAHQYYERVVTLGTIASRRVWDLLLEAQEAGLPLVMAGRAAEPVRVHAEAATPRVDVGHDGGDLVVRPVLDLPTLRVPPSHQVLGDPPHGVVWAAGGSGSGLDLARLAVPPHPMLARLGASGPLRIPASDEARFLDEYVGQLLQHVEVVCGDGSVELPAPRPPVLHLTLARPGGHRLRIVWAWHYTVGTVRRAEPLALPSGVVPSGRDPAAEAHTLEEVSALLAARVPGLPQVSPDPARRVAEAELDGIDTARFLSDAVPALRGRSDVEVEVDTAVAAAAYRQADEAPVIRFAAADDQAAGPGTQDWFDLSVTVTVEGHDVPFQRLFVALAREEKHLLLDNGVWFSLERPEFAELARMITESRELLDAPPATVRLSRYHAGLWDDVERLGEIVGGPRVEAWRACVEAVTTAVDLPRHKVPLGLTATLRPYQVAGFAWLATLYDLRLGGILADDMGLGKTLQALALMVHVRDRGRTDAPFLVVAPTSVVANWATEAARFAPDLRVATITQMAARRGHDLAAAVAGADLVVTSYTLFRLEFEEYRTRTWAGMVLDEAQNIKNHHSAGYRCARDLPADVKFAITGTPMENHLMELWSLLSITAPGLFARADRFTEYYRTPIERSQDGERLAQLRRRIRPLLLRRTKDQVARDLPDRQEQVMELALNARHRTIYSRYLQRERQKVLGLLGDVNRHRFEIFRSLTLLRQASLDVSLVDPAHDAVPSTKLDALVEQLEGIVAEGHRVLVFSQFTRFLGKARARLDAAGIETCYLDGSTTNRPQVISDFRTGTAPVFLISLKAGGTGLTLTEADYVVLLDPWWNPATEAQAIDRAHRIGQVRNVMVYRMVAKDTIEEKVMALKARKAELTASVLGGEDFAAAALTADDIRGLLS